MPNLSSRIIRVFSLVGALISICSFVFMAHLGIKLPKEPIWAPLAQIWENYVIAMTVFIKSPYPLMLALGTLLIAGLFGFWVGRSIGKWVSRFG